MRVVRRSNLKEHELVMETRKTSDKYDGKGLSQVTEREGSQRKFRWKHKTKRKCSAE